jgi:carbonyl reductase 1
VRQLALQYPKSPLNTGPLLIYLTARDRSRGADAVERLRRDPALLAARALTPTGGLSEIEFAQLDIADQKSIDGFAEFLKKEHPEGIDIC